jgi:hypothetical protein
MTKILPAALCNPRLPALPLGQVQEAPASSDGTGHGGNVMSVVDTSRQVVARDGPWLFVVAQFRIFPATRVTCNP